MVTMIVAALVLGASAGLKDTAASAVKDAYNGLKGLISRRYGTVSVAGLEAKPESTAQREALRESLDDAGAGSDIELADLARRLIAAVQEYDPEALRVTGVTVKDLKTGSIDISGVESTGDGVVIERAEVQGDTKISNVKAGGGKVSRDP